MAAKHININPPHTIIFDLGKVIIDFDHMTFCNNLAPFCAVSPAAVYERIFLSGLEKLFDSGRLSPAAFFETIRTELSFTIDMDHFTRLWCDIFTPRKAMEELLQELHGRYRLLCLSNTNPWHFNWCRRHFAILELFDEFVLSYREKCCKPDDKIYQKAVNKAHAPARHCIYIDDLAANVRAAARSGMTAFLFTSAVKLERDLSEAGVLSQDRDL